MYIGIKHLHSYFAVLILAILIFVVIYSLISRFTGKSFTKRSKLIALLGLITLHSQILFGLMLYFVSPLGISNLSGEAMKNSLSRLYVLEHPLIMILAAILVTIGYSKAKKLIGNQKGLNKIILFYGLALILVISRTPWQAWN